MDPGRVYHLDYIDHHWFLSGEGTHHEKGPGLSEPEPAR